MAIDTHKTICNSLTTTTCRNVDRRDSFLGRPHAKAHGEPISAQTPSPIREWGERRIMRRPGRRALGLMASGATCVQKLDGSRDSAIHTKYRILLRSSSMREPRYPLPRVVLLLCKIQHTSRPANEATSVSSLLDFLGAVRAGVRCFARNVKRCPRGQPAHT